MQNGNWKELDYNVASDYSFGSPEEIRSILRKTIKIPQYLPGEENESIQSKHQPRDSFKTFIQRKLQGNIRQVK